MKKLILLFLLLPFFSFSQVMNQPNDVAQFMGSVVVDGMNVIPVCDTVFAPTYPATARRKGALITHYINKKPYHFNGAKWVCLLTESTSTINSWTTITATFKQVVAGEGYIAESSGGVILDFLLPQTANVGDVFAIHGRGAGGWKISQNANQFIHISGNTTTVGVTGYVLRQTRYDYIELRCIAPDEWECSAKVGDYIICL